MSGTQKLKKEESLKELRTKIVSYITFLRSRVPSITRSCFCLAITIFDKCQSLPYFYIPKQYDRRQREWMLAIACIAVSFKFLDGMQKFRFNVLLKELRIKDGDDAIYAKITNLENQILCQLGGKIPFLTAFEQLDDTITKEDLENDITRKNVLICLKILLKAYILGPEISLKPTLGPQLYLIASGKRGASQEAKTLYNRCLKCWTSPQKSAKSS